VAVDSSGNVFLTGWSLSSNFPVPGGFDTTFGGFSEAFVAKVTNSGQLAWASYLGGNNYDYGYGVAVDSSGNVFLTGRTNSTNFPVPRGFDTSCNGNQKAFVAKVTSSGQLAWASFLGGSSSNYGRGIVVDTGGNVFLTGDTNSTDFPTPGGFDTIFNGSTDVFVAKIVGGLGGTPPSEEYHYGFQDDKSGSTSDPVHTATGNFFHSETDLSIVSRGSPMVFSRYYNSKDARTGPLGPGWTHSYNIYLKQEPNLISVHWGDGRTDYWNPDANSNYEPNTVGLYDRLVNDGNNWTVTKKSLDKYIFDSNGLLTSVRDKNGNAITLAYNHPTDPNLLTSVTDPASRTLNLVYTGTLLTTIIDFASPARSISYTYTAGRLTQVTDINSNAIQYGYDANGYLNTVTDQRGITTVTNVYDANGIVTEQRDGRNNLTTFAYDTPIANQTTITDSNGKVTIHTHITGYKLLYTIKNPLGQSIFYGYDEQGNRTAVTDRNGNTTLFVYDSRGNVIRTTNPDGGATTVDYNDPNFPDLPTKKTDANNYVTQWWYDSNGNVIRQIDPNANQRTWTYNSFGQKLTETDEANNITTYNYDLNRLLTEIVDPNGNHTWFGYDTLWRLTHITDGRGSSAGDPCHTTVTTYDKVDRVVSVTRPITSESYQYDNVGNRTGVTNGRGYKTVYRYDNSNNLTKIERPAPAGQTQITEYVYDELNRKIRTIDPNGNTTAYQYDAAGRLLKETNAEGNETSYTYDPHGNMLSVTDGNGIATFYEYDSMNRKVGQYDQLGNHWYWQYNKLGQLTKHTDAMDYKTNYEYDSLGQLVRVIDDSNNVTQYKYDAVGNLLEIIDANGITSQCKYYDTANRLIRKEDALGHAYEYTYDCAGNQISRKDAEGHITTYAYDNENRLTDKHYPDGNNVTYGYNNNGSMVSMTDLTGTTTYTYDELDRLTSSTDSFGKQVQYGYDIIGNRTSITYPADSNNSARTVTYTYDRVNRLDKITDWAARTWDYTVDGAGRVIEVNYPNGTMELRTYDTAGRLATLSHKGPNDVNLIAFQYTRDAQGNPTEINESGTLAPVLNLPVKEEYTYDEDNRLEETTRPATYGYDDNGNMTSRIMGGTTTTFTYDFENRLISQTTGASVVRHIYDGQGNRIARNNNGQVTRYILDHGRSMSHIPCETDSFGQIIAYYIHGPQILARVSADGSIHYYHTDHIGSVTALSDPNGLITDRYAYTPFGVSAGSEGTTSNPFTYIGSLGVMTETDGLYFMRARFYDPDTGRFLSRDPIENSKGESLYEYTNNSPITFYDPLGLFSVVIYDTEHDTLLYPLGALSHSKMSRSGDGVAIGAGSLKEAAEKLKDLPKAGQIDELYIVDHGQPGNQTFGSDNLTQYTIFYNSSWQEIASTVKENGTIHLMGCNVAKGEFGENYLQDVADSVGGNRMVTGYDDYVHGFFSFGKLKSFRASSTSTSPIDSPSEKKTEDGIMKNVRQISETNVKSMSRFVKIGGTK
jgi:RHS repeat-associated protein